MAQRSTNTAASADEAMASRATPPHPLALFSLESVNERAKTVLKRPENEPFVSTQSNRTLALDIGHIRSKAGKHTLAIRGRGDAADVFVEGSSIAKIQCSFEIDSATNIVMLYDRSHGQTTQVFGENATPFEYGRLRKVVVQKGLNTIIGMGGKGRNLVQFQLVWRQDPDMTIEKIRGRECIAGGYEEPPRLAQTVADEADTVLPSRRETRIHTPGSVHPKMRYATIGQRLGAGQFGTVYKAVDADSGRLMAVKVMEQPEMPSKQQRKTWRDSVYYALKREVENLARIDHPHVVNYIASQGWDGSRIEIFMGLKEGNLESLVEKGAVLAAETVFHHMLQALDCLAVNNIIHRDVKPENILYVTQPDGEHQFQLGDFGLCNAGVNAKTFIGTPIYLAPEIWKREKQTHKVDVWSLFVTMIWVLDLRAFRRELELFETADDVSEAVLAASNEQAVSIIRAMAIINPEDRASAAQMLVRCFDGVRLSTPRDQVPTLSSNLAVTSSPSSAPLISATAKPPAVKGSKTASRFEMDRHRIRKVYDPNPKMR